GAQSCAQLLSLLFVVFFFFQAEDGIRDFHVTGVQTCALPILTTTDVTDHHYAPDDAPEPMIRLEGVGKTYPGSDIPAVESLDLEIGRASCRERAQHSAGAAPLHRKRSGAGIRIAEQTTETAG